MPADHWGICGPHVWPCFHASLERARLVRVGDGHHPFLWAGEPEVPGSQGPGADAQTHRLPVVHDKGPSVSPHVSASTIISHESLCRTVCVDMGLSPGLQLIRVPLPGSHCCLFLTY